MHRFYAAPGNSSPSRFGLDEADSYHALHVLRLGPGDQAEVVFRGERYLAVIESCQGTGVTLAPLEKLPSTEPRLSVTLFQGLPKGDKMDLIVQKACELGVARIVPVSFSRSIVKLADKDSQRKTERWRKIAREAGKQSGRCVVPEIDPVIPFRSLPSCFPACAAVAVPWEECGEGGPLSFVRRHPSLPSLGIVIGPEGGISPEEMDVMLRHGCEAITLGSRILRTETAGLAAVSVFFGLYGEME